MLLSIAQKIQSQNYTPDIIVGIARGGLIPTRILTDLLETPQLGFIQVEFYADIQQTLQKPILKLTQKQQGKRTLNQEVAKLIKAGMPKQLAEKLLKDMN
jgi:hypoxanthine phosphoribosyltransferase